MVRVPQADHAEPGPGAVWTAGRVARELGIAESTLRAWHHRYGVGPHNPRPGRYRRYTAEDVRALRRMRDLIASGVLPSDAALTLASGRQDAPSELVAEVVAAARALDSGRCCAVLGRSVAEHGVVWTWDRLCRPALRTVDADQRTDPDRVDIEHALSWSVSVALHRAPRGGEAGPPSVLLACTEPELHALPLEALAAALAERGCPARMLGAATPARGLVRAVAATRAESVVLWSQTAATAEDAALRELGSARARRITAGPGWPGGPRQGDAHVTSLGGALELLTGQR